MSSHHAIRSFVLPDGERYCLLIHAPSGVPLYYPTLYVTTQIRNASTSVSVLEAALSAINILFAFCRERKINLEPPRDSWRPQLLREWSHKQIHQVFP